jgi:RNA recognition motif-containing protein
MKDSFSGKSRGFGFVLFNHPKILDRVLKQDHVIDGKMVIFEKFDFKVWILTFRLMQSAPLLVRTKTPLKKYLLEAFH